MFVGDYCFVDFLIGFDDYVEDWWCVVCFECVLCDFCCGDGGEWCFLGRFLDY